MVGPQRRAGRRTPLSRAFRAWRLPTTVAAAGGVVVQLPFQGCVGAESLAGDAFCAPWLEPPKFAAGLVGLDASPALGAVANIGSCVVFCRAFVLPQYYGLAPDGRPERPRRASDADEPHANRRVARAGVHLGRRARAHGAAGRRLRRGLGAARPLPLADGDAVRHRWNSTCRRPCGPVGALDRCRRAAVPRTTAARASARRACGVWRARSPTPRAAAAAAPPTRDSSRMEWSRSSAPRSSVPTSTPRSSPRCPTRSPCRASSPLLGFRARVRTDKRCVVAASWATD